MEHRNGTHARPYTVRMKKRNMAVTAVVVLLSIVLIAGIVTLSPLGDWLTEHVFQPVTAYLNPDKKEDQGIVSALKTQEQQPSASPTASASAIPLENSMIIAETPFYLLQMGVFTGETQAKEHADKIRAMGGGGVVYCDQTLYRVFAAAYRDEESLKKVQSQVRTDGFEATPYILEQNSVRITLKGNTEAVKATETAVELLTVIPSTLCDLSLQFDKQTLDGDVLKKNLHELNEKLNETMAAFKKLPSGSVEPLQNCLQKYADRISTFLAEHDTIIKANAGDLKHLQIECIIDYIQFFERK